MSRLPAQPRRRREVLVLVLGLASAALLGAAALAPFSDPALAGRAAFAQLAGSVFDGVGAEWERLLREPRLAGGDSDAQWRWDSQQLARARDLTDEPLESANPVADSAFEVLLAEARRQEAKANPAEARDTALEALEKPAGPARRSAARLVVLRTARALGDTAMVRAQWSAAAAELDGSESLDGEPALVLCGLAAAASLSEEDRQALAARLIDAWCAARLALPDEGRALDLEVQTEGGNADPSTPQLLSAALRARTPRRDALRERIVALSPEGDMERISTYEELRSLSALDEFLGGVPPRPSDERWHLRPWRGLLLAVRAEGTESVCARLESPAALAAELERRVDASELLPEGFALDFAGDGAGESVRPRHELQGPQLAFTLRHADPERAARSQTTRLALLRAALGVVALLTAAAGVATFLAVRHSRRLSELKSSFVANVSHELRTPLASILMLAENLEAGRVDGEAARERYHGLIRREAERLRRLVTDLLDFARLERGAGLELLRDEVILSDFLDQLAREAAAWAQRAGVELQIRLERSQARVRLDGEALRRALLNLLDNARKHSGSTQIAFSAQLRDGELVLAVEDEGRGVPGALRERIFEPFARLEREGGAPGTGLGLAIVREIAAAHGGTARLGVPSGGRGARFELCLPLSSSAAASPALEAPA
jgi:signal transduction histidine kinase